MLLFLCLLMMSGANAANLQPIEGQLQQIMLQIAEIYDCKNLAHLPSSNTTTADNLWMAYFKDDVEHHMTLLPMNNSITLLERHPYRLCVTSFSPETLKKATFGGREWKRPVKIHLDLNDENLVPINFWYNHNGTDFYSPLVISLRAASHRFAQSRTVCPDTDDFQSVTFTQGQDQWSLVGNPDIKQLLCPPALKGKTIRTSFMPITPYIYFNDDGELDGADMSILKTLAEKNGFIPQIYKEVSWFAFNENNTLIGNIGSLVHKHTHIAMGGHYFQEVYFRYIDFLDTYSYNVVYQSAKPTKLPPYVNMMKPFTLQGWLCIFGSLIFAMLFYSFLGHISDYRKDDKVMNALDMFANQLSQGIPEGKRTSINVFLIAWTWYTFFIHSIYDCNLRAYMLLSDKTPIVDDVQDIWDQGRDRYFYTDYDETTIHDALSWEAYKYEKLVFNRAKERKLLFSFDENGDYPIEVERRVIEEGAVITTNDMIFYSNYQAKTRKRWGYDPFRISKNPARVYPSSSGMPVRKDSILKEVFDPQVWAMRSGGLELHFLDNNYIEAQLDEPLEPIDWRHLMLGNGLLILGLLLSSLAFMNEYFLEGKLWNPKRKVHVEI